MSGNRLRHHAGPVSIVVAILVTVSLAGCPKSDTGGSDAETTLDRLKTTGKARVGFANEAPYAYRNDETGELTGEAPTVARHVLQQLSVAQTEGVLTEFGSLIPAIKADRVDLIAAGMYITPERCKQILFSEPTYCIGEAFLVKAGNPKDLHSYTDVKENSDVKLGVVSGTVEVGYARKVGIPDEQLVKFPDMPSAAAGVAAGRADAFAGTSLTVQDLLKKMPDSGLERAEPFEPLIIDGEPIRGCGAFGFRKSDTALRDAFNRVLADYIGSEAHLQAVAPFGFGEAQLPGTATTAQLCTP